jgi:hypothetical protein
LVHGTKAFGLLTVNHRITFSSLLCSSLETPFLVLNCRFNIDVAEIMKRVKEGGVVEVQKRPDNGPPPPVDSSNWEGLNSSVVYQRYPG